MSILFSDPFIALLEDTSDTDKIMARCNKPDKTPCPFLWLTRWAIGWPSEKGGPPKGNTNAKGIWNGRKHTDETKQKMRESAKKRWEDSDQKNKLSKYRSSVMGEQNKGRKWFNDGMRNYFRYPHEQQSDWVMGLIHFGSNQ